MFTKKGDEERSKIKQTISETLPPFVEQAVTDFNFVNKRLLTTANVIVDAKGLEKIPSECMHSIRLKVNIPNIPENIDPVALLVMGRPADDAEPLDMHSKYRDLNEVVVYDTF